MISLYSSFITLQRNRTSSFMESPIMEHLRRPLVYSSDRSATVVTESLSDENFDNDNSEALPIVHYASPSPVPPVETHTEASIPDEGHACCPLCLTAFGSSTHASMVRLSCGTLLTTYQYPSTGLMVRGGHVAHYGCAVTLQYASDTGLCPKCLIPLDWECMKTVFWTGEDNCQDPIR